MLTVTRCAINLVPFPLNIYISTAAAQSPLQDHSTFHQSDHGSRLIALAEVCKSFRLSGEQGWLSYENLDPSKWAQAATPKSYLRHSSQPPYHLLCYKSNTKGNFTCMPRRQQREQHTQWVGTLWPQRRRQLWLHCWICPNCCGRLQKSVSRPLYLRSLYQWRCRFSLDDVKGMTMDSWMLQGRSIWVCKSLKGHLPKE